MLSNILDKVSFWALFCVIALLPIFFIPFTGIPVETSKGLLLVMGLVVSVIAWAAARFRDGKVSVSRSWLLVSGAGIVLASLLSALFSPAMNLSLFGVMLDMGSVCFILSAFLLFLFSSIVLRESRKAVIALFGFLAASSLLMIFQVLRLIMPEVLTLGILGAKTDSLVGSWNSFGIFAGLSVVTSVFLLEFFPLGKAMKWALGVLAVFSLFFVTAVNLTFLWIMLGVFLLLIFVYKVMQSHAGGEKTFPIYSFIAMMISLLFIMSGQFLGSYLPDALGISSTEIRPSLSSTMWVTGRALYQDPVFGAGANRFAEVWALHKPSSINGSIFWNTSFSAGSGLLPTFASTTGALGILAWLSFIFFLIFSATKEVSFSLRKKFSRETILFLLLSLFLFTGSFLYPVGPVLFLPAFAFAGIFVGMSSADKQRGEISLSTFDDPKKSYVSILALSILMLLSAAAGFKYVERFASAAYWSDTLSASTVERAEAMIGKAAALHPNDLYFRMYAQVYAVKINEILSKPSLTDADKALLQESLDQAVRGAEMAVVYDPTNYLNYVSLASIYDAAGGLGVEGAYEKAAENYLKASEKNPLNPGIQLALSRVAFAQGNSEEARTYGKKALELKPDYLDAYIVLSQLEKSQGNIEQALSYAQEAGLIAPDNQEVQGYISSLKNGQ